MSSTDTSPRDVKAIVARYKTMGFYGGMFLGAIVGVMIAGPNLNEWPWVRSAVTIIGAMVLFGIAGYFGGELAVGGQAAGPGGAMFPGDGEHSSGSSGLDASGSGGGDGGGDGGHH